MKTHAFFGSLMALAGALMTLLFYFLDFHNDPGKFLLGLGLHFIVGITITIVGLVIGIRAVRSEKGTGPFGYGQALLAGVLITVFSSVIGTAFHVAYIKFINPNYLETRVQWVRGMMERGNMPYDQVEEKITEMREKSTVVAEARSGIIGGIVIGTLVSLVAAAFLKRNPAPDTSPV